MQTNWPDTQVCLEIREFNREFLDLVCEDCSPGAAYGLASPVRQRLRSLAPARLEAIADTPCLLAAFSLLSPRRTPGEVADAPLPPEPSAQADAARLFAASLLVWLWHTARQDRLLAALCIGPGRLAVEHLNSAGFRDLQRTAAGSAGCLEARFCRNLRLWPDLVRAAGSSDGQLLTATRLSIVQLTLISRN
jgi:hypothetical protein